MIGITRPPLGTDGSRATKGSEEVRYPPPPLAPAVAGSETTSRERTTRVTTKRDGRILGAGRVDICISSMD
jgi:hypothetical protein